MAARRTGESAPPDLSPFACASGSASRWRDTKSRMCRKDVARVPSCNRLGIVPTRDNPGIFACRHYAPYQWRPSFRARSTSCRDGTFVRALPFFALERAACFVTQPAPARNCQLRIWHTSEDISDGLSRLAKD